jgi:hypothetical protein
MCNRKRYHVELLIICSGWINVWTEEDEHGKVEPQTFASRAEAVAEVEDFLATVRSAGAMAESYRRSHFRVRVAPIEALA